MHAVLLYAGKGKIKIQKLSKNGKERMLATKEMSWKEPEQKRSKAKRFQRTLVLSVFLCSKIILLNVID